MEEAVTRGGGADAEHGRRGVRWRRPRRDGAPLAKAWHVRLLSACVFAVHCENAVY